MKNDSVASERNTGEIFHEERSGHEGYPHLTTSFMTVSADDRIVNIAGVDRRVENLRSAGIEIEYRKYKHACHGFGLGVGTDAEGLIEDTIQFWENHL